MAYYNNGIFLPKNPDKYIGKYPIQYRSSWELLLCNKCDQHPSILQWAYESLEIPYQDPFTGQWRKYIPDFFLVYVDIDGIQHREIIEIKPTNQTIPEMAKNKRNQEALIINLAKWKVAQAWCNKNQIGFRVLTEAQLFATKK
jgi:hypothetical protein